MNIEKTVIHEIHEKTRNSISRQSAQRVLANDLGCDIAQWAITRKNSNRYYNFVFHLTGDLLHKSKFLIYFVSFVLFVDEKRLLA
ncbi:MAG: hypothetical protein Q7T38_08845 [Gallionella sp.]|nr:hypothetical protein [Gallionella sp.]